MQKTFEMGIAPLPLERVNIENISNFKHLYVRFSILPSIICMVATELKTSLSPPLSHLFFDSGGSKCSYLETLIFII